MPSAGEGRPDAQAAGEETDLALYIHWPFCVSKCPYCDFNSHVRESIDQGQWRDALLADLAYEATQTPGHRLTSIFFGGGTPSLMPPKTVAALIEVAQRHWEFADDIEITLEANPSSVEARRFADLARAGVNRVSLGIQSLDPAALKFLGRAHDVEEALMALGTAQSAFARTSFDLIYALPGQSAETWEAQLRQALDFGTDHLSLYQLTIEPGTRFAALAAKGELESIDPDRAAELYELTGEITGAAGLPAYEISNHAQPGQESRHNLAYWRYQSYIGVGPGAHGRRGGASTQRHKKPENWLAALGRNSHGIVEERMIAAEERGIEALLMGLRLREGVDLYRIAKLAGRDPVDRAAIARLEAQGLLVRDDERLRATPGGMLVLDALLVEIISA
ncbi:radical SAM family heme chaperone HemW [Sphingosinicella sp. LHD-64]|uniref:radical SAM family heme chaperone HemW n=1 Tax=Sphingosinicella sp. LHD-64 TaxID=3072139 RepID=UPI00280D42AA|nr:radical SAM family heme chaperone HemW [Sphingosinicella sp. LHD-64]MDQ8756433.1 radical SAM family heme chaperone HemW [Sphingosinicella sp. LHD-64]